MTSEEKTCTATKLTGYETLLETGWCMAKNTLTYSFRPVMSGDVRLIRQDGCSMTLNKGIKGNEGTAADGKANSLTIRAGRQGAVTLPAPLQDVGMGENCPGKAAHLPIFLPASMLRPSPACC